MATSGVTAWSLTARDIITAALQEHGILPIGEQPDSPEADVCLLRLNAILKSWQIGLHLQSRANVSVPADSASGALAADVQDVTSVRYAESGTNERLLARWERDEYLSLPNKAASGTPTIYYVEEQANSRTLYIWPVPTSTITLKIDYLRKPEIVTDLSQTVDFPEKYNEALYALLAVRCAGVFGAVINPELAARAEYLRREIEDMERPASYMLGGHW